MNNYDTNIDAPRAFLIVINSFCVINFSQAFHSWSFAALIDHLRALIVKGMITFTS